MKKFSLVCNNCGAGSKYTGLDWKTGWPEDGFSFKCNACGNMTEDDDLDEELPEIEEEDKRP
jgi:hypothetical protein